MSILTPLLPEGSREVAHAFMLFMISPLSCSRKRRTVRHLHERIIDRDNEDLTSFLELGVVDISGDVGAGAGRACYELCQNCTLQIT